MGLGGAQLGPCRDREAPTATTPAEGRGPRHARLGRDSPRGATAASPGVHRTYWNVREHGEHVVASATRERDRVCCVVFVARAHPPRALTEIERGHGKRESVWIGTTPLMESNASDEFVVR
ncbi:hypothetical protein MTO96_025730 [Rhipicephalus appendiculatus]